jgi:hypothetical protein
MALAMLVAAALYGLWVAPFTYDHRGMQLWPAHIVTDRLLLFIMYIVAWVSAVAACLFGFAWLVETAFSKHQGMESSWLSPASN